MVEPRTVEREMIDLAKKIDPTLVPLNDAQTAAYNLSHALGASFIESSQCSNAAPASLPGSAQHRQ